MFRKGYKIILSEFFMDKLDLNERAKKINEMRVSVIDYLGPVFPKSIRTIESKGFFVSSICFEDKPKEIYVVVDFTSKQIEHLHDLNRYTKSIYKNFMEHGGKFLN